METRKKIVIIGLDGGSFDVILPLIEQGKLPYLASLMQNGSWGELRSVIPPVTASAWVSFMTGVNPGKHGVFGFVGPVQDGYYRKVLNYSSIKFEKVWNILSNYNLNVGLFNVPFTFPPAKIKGFVVPEGSPPGVNTAFTYPEHLWNELKREIVSEFANPDFIKFWFTDKKDDLLKDIFANLEWIKNCIDYLRRNYQWDILMTVFTDIDRIQHFFWKYTDESHPAFIPSVPDIYKTAIYRAYQNADEFLGQMMEEMGEEVYFLLVSDHGFGPNYKSVYVNRWLNKIGLLSLKPTTYFLRRYKFPQNVYKLLLKVGLRYINPIIVSNLEGDANDVEPRMSLNIYSLIDWSKTYAYSGHRSEQGIFINLKGREPQGIVSPGSEYEQIRDTVIKALLELKDPEDGLPVVDTVNKREEIYSGPYVNYAPDILYKMRDYSYKGVEYVYQGDIFEEERWLSGAHREKGIFILKGPHIKKGWNIKGARIIDMSPLILFLMRLPVPQNMDGRVLVECFEDDYLNSHPVEILESFSEFALQDDRVYSAEEEKKIKETLKSLGYID